MTWSTIKATFIILAFTTATLVTAQIVVLPEPCNGTACNNPTPGGVLAYQDMTVVRRLSDQLYFRFSKGNYSGDGLNVATSPTLRGPWNYAYSILGGATNSKVCTDSSKTNRWAPEAHYINGKYYLYYGLNCPPFAFDQMVAVSSTMNEGDWTDYNSMGLPAAPIELATYPDGSIQNREAYVRLDGNLIATADNPNGVASTPYMTIGSYQLGIYGFPLSSDLRYIASGATPRKIISDTYRMPLANEPDQSGNYTEGPYQLVHGNYIYLFYSRGACCTAPSTPVAEVYVTEVCRTPLSQGPTGKYVDRNGADCLNGDHHRPGTVVLQSNGAKTVWGPGSVGVLKDAQEGLVLYYQYLNASGKNTIGFGFNYLKFDSNDWPYISATK